MPATASIALANNKGGSGKTFLLFQLACEAARTQPGRKVLVIDFSLYSDTSALLLGGLLRESPLGPTKGKKITEVNTSKDTRAEGMLRDLLACAHAGIQAAAPTTSLFGAFFGAFSATTPQGPLDLESYMLRPAVHNPRIPENLYLVPSAGSASWGNTNTGLGRDDMDVDQETPFWARQHSKDWWPVAQQLRKACDALTGEWTVFVDTDHLAASPLSKVALGAVNNTVVPLSLDAADFSRLFDDTTGNALFTDVMMPLAVEGMLGAPVSKFVFQKVMSVANSESTTKGGILSPFKPAKLVQEEMDAIADSLRIACSETIGDPRLQLCLSDYKPNMRAREFANYFTAFKTIADLPANTSKNFGAPLCTMTASDSTLGASRPEKTVLNSLKVEINSTLCAILGEDFRNLANNNNVEK